MRKVHRNLLLGTVALGLLAAAVPVIGAGPSSANRVAGPGGDPVVAAAPSQRPGKPDKGAKQPVTVSGKVTQGTDDQGRPTFTISDGAKAWILSAGPAWFYGDRNPLKAYVGASVTVVGTTHAGGNEVDVRTVNGKAIRTEGRPPWAGGPWVVGKTHPGWKDTMADGKPGNGHGREQAPGQQKRAGG